jgi:hypothetical protein
MKQSYTSYLNVLSGTRLNVLENLVTNKYTKFRKFYKIVSKFSGDIAHMCYKFSEDSDSLDIDITVDPSIDPEDFIDEIKVLGLNSTTATITVDSILNYISTSTDYKKSDIVYTFICNVIKNNPQIWLTILYKYPTSTSNESVIYNLTNYNQSRTTLYNIDKK